MSADAATDPIYLLGQSAAERDRLMYQGRILAPGTERFLRDAGLVAGMRVLDVGCGVGDVSLLCANLVGPSGEVVGVDRDPAALARAEERAAALARRNVRFIAADYRELPQSAPFDAIVGRIVLMYAADPAAAIRTLLPHLRAGGVVAFQEYDFSAMIALPPLPVFDQLLAWWRQTSERAGVELQMGLKLFATYQAAGLPAPRLTAETVIGGGPDFAGYLLLAGVVRSILPLMAQLAIARPEQVGIETLADRLRAEAVAGGGVLTLPMTVGAAARTG